MEKKYIGILVCRSLEQNKCPLINDVDVKYLSDNGYLDATGGLTKKANDLLSAVEICSNLFEDSYVARQEASDVVNGVKKTFEGMFTAFRNNASNMFQSMADNIKK
jgi:isopentenyl phosphate kinase